MAAFLGLKELGPDTPYLALLWPANVAPVPIFGVLHLPKASRIGALRGPFKV